MYPGRQLLVIPDSFLSDDRLCSNEDNVAATQYMLSDDQLCSPPGVVIPAALIAGGGDEPGLGFGDVSMDMSSAHEYCWEVHIIINSVVRSVVLTLADTGLYVLWIALSGLQDRLSLIAAVTC